MASCKGQDDGQNACEGGDVSLHETAVRDREAAEQDCAAGKQGGMMPWMKLRSIGVASSLW